MAEGPAIAIPLIIPPGKGPLPFPLSGPLLGPLVNLAEGRPKSLDTALAAQRLLGSRNPALKQLGAQFAALARGGISLASADAKTRGAIGRDVKQAVDTLVSQGFGRTYASQRLTQIISQRSAAPGRDFPLSPSQLKPAQLARDLRLGGQPVSSLPSLPRPAIIRPRQTGLPPLPSVPPPPAPQPAPPSTGQILVRQRPPGLPPEVTGISLPTGHPLIATLPAAQAAGVVGGAISGAASKIATSFARHFLSQAIGCGELAATAERFLRGEPLAVGDEGALLGAAAAVATGMPSEACVGATVGTLAAQFGTRVEQVFDELRRQTGVSSLDQLEQQVAQRQGLQRLPPPPQPAPFRPLGSQPSTPPPQPLTIPGPQGGTPPPQPLTIPGPQGGTPPPQLTIPGPQGGTPPPQLTIPGPQGGCPTCTPPPPGCPPELVDFVRQWQEAINCGAIEQTTQITQKIGPHNTTTLTLTAREPLCLCCDSEQDLQLYITSNGLQGRCTVVKNSEMGGAQ